MNKKTITITLLVTSLVFGACSVFATVNDSTNTVDVNSQVNTTYLQVTPIMVSSTNGDIDPNQTSTCLELKSDNLRYKSKDATTNGEVTDLQDFLGSVSLLKLQPTGYFGLVTYNAVRQFQKMVGLSQTGYVGPLTKSKIKDVSCSGGQITGDIRTEKKNKGNSYGEDDATEINSQNTFSLKKTEVYNVSRACTMEARICPDGRMMRRNPNNCEWLTWSCNVPPSASGTMLNIEANKYVCEKKEVLCSKSSSTFNENSCKEVTALCRSISGESSDGQEINSFNTFPIKNIYSSTTPPPARMCTMEARLCPDGKMMPRDASCGWHPEKCSTSGSGAPGAPVGF